MTNAVAVHGAGPLATRLAACVAPEPTLVFLTPLDRIDEMDDIHAGLAGDTRVLLVGSWRSMVYVGPYWRPGTAGCPRCLTTRVANSPFGPDQEGHRVVPTSGATGTMAALGLGVLRMVEAAVQRRLDACGPATDVHVLDGLTGQAETQRLLPDSVCPTCGGRAGTDTLPAFTDHPQPKLGPTTLRGRPVDPDHIERTYLFSGLGLFKEVKRDLQSPFGACSVELPTRWGGREPAIGRARTYRGAQAIAVLEGLERYTGLHRGGRRAAVRAAYADVADRAVYPPSLGLHPAESYATPGFRYRPFDPTVAVDWVWAYSFRRREPVLVPERSAFWGHRDDEISFSYETSNGCAVGATPEEATLHGLRELAERDSFLLTWYRRLALPEVDLAGATDAGLRDLVRQAELFTGFRIRAFLSTMEYGLPSFWLAAVGPAADDPDAKGPAVIAGAGAHPDPTQALLGGLYELTGTVLRAHDSYPRERDRGLHMLHDPLQVRRMEDHTLVNGRPEARERFAFLLDRDEAPIPLAEVPATVRADRPDLRADLDTAVAGLHAAGLDVLVVDQTMPELGPAGVVCVKVIVPGLAPITFGHLNRRTAHLPRLAGEVPLPYPSQLPVGADPGALPHPFP